MKTEPVKKIRTPKYPTRMEVLASPELLQRGLPRAWRNCAEMAGALALFLSANTLAHSQENAAPQQPAQATEPAAKEQKPEMPPELRKLLERRCQVVMVGVVESTGVPIFTEETSWDIIKRDLRKAKIGPKDGRWPPKTETAPVIVWSELDGNVETSATRVADQKDIGFVSFDPKKRIGFIVVPYLDLFRSGFNKTLEQTATKGSAPPDAAPANEPPAYIAVFEDALSAAECEQPDKSLRKRKAEARRLLRQQVADFVAWLKAQGAI